MKEKAKREKKAHLTSVSLRKKSQKLKERSDEEEKSSKSKDGGRSGCVVECWCHLIRTASLNQICVSQRLDYTVRVLPFT